MSHNQVNTVNQQRMLYPRLSSVSMTSLTNCSTVRCRRCHSPRLWQCLFRLRSLNSFRSPVVCLGHNRGSPHASLARTIALLLHFFDCLRRSGTWSWRCTLFRLPIGTKVDTQQLTTDSVSRCADGRPLFILFLYTVSSDHPKPTSISPSGPSLAESVPSTFLPTSREHLFSVFFSRRTKIKIQTSKILPTPSIVPTALNMSSSSRISTAKDLRNDLRRADRTSHWRRQTRLHNSGRLVKDLLPHGNTPQYLSPRRLACIYFRP